MSVNRALSIDFENLSPKIEDKGFAVIEGVVGSSTIDPLIEDIGRLNANNAVRRTNGHPFGIRDALNVVPSAKKLAENNLLGSIAHAMLGKNTRVVRSLFFDKSPEANWKVTWHQDLTIAVREKRNVKGFGPWTTKAGIVHVQPPTYVLEKMITLRIHLDDSDESNGALKLIPGSHRLGRLTQSQIESLTRESRPVLCSVPRGGVLAMRPLLLHSSSAGFRPTHRRVVHLDFAGADLPGGLEWHGS